ncbi:MAG: multiheme c-type cytochrome [Planctomycetota bacterium]
MGIITIAITSFVAADYIIAIPADVQATFVGRQSCVECHSTQSHAFAGSHHDLAMDIATDRTVLGDFNDVEFVNDGIVSRLYRDGDRFMISTEGPTGEMEDFEVKYVFGVDPLQQYMVEFDRPDDAAPNEVGRLQVLRISWDTNAKKWFYLRPPDVPEKLEPGDPLHWTGVAQRWQTMCADCHSTNLQRNFDVKTLTYRTTFSEIDVSCESCHGPASLHLELARSGSLFWDRNHGFGLAALKGDDPTTQLESCAPCHSRRGVMDATFQAGDRYCDHYNLELLRSDTYHHDGQIKDEVYVFGSFVQSKMYHKGIRCTDCHDPHTLEMKHPGNETCTSCHQHSAGKYDVPSHHHHEVGTAGAMCVNCHMPHTTYMAVDARRDHSLRVPRPDLSVKFGTPNACSSCHVRDQLEQLPTEQHASLELYQDWLAMADEDETIASAIAKTDQWCDEACEKWYGADRQTPAHYGEVLARLRRGDSSAIASALKLVTRPPTDVTPVLARATALDELMQQQPREAVRAAEELLEQSNEHPILRATAARAMSVASPRDAVDRLMPLLEPESQDPSRLVRSEAARALVSSGGYELVRGRRRTIVDDAVEMVRDELMVASDRGGAHMGWAMLCEQRGKYLGAVKAYQDAIRVEPETTGPRTNLAALYESLLSESGRNATARQAVDAITGGDAAVLRQQAQLLRAAELPLLRRDAELARDNADIQYRYGLALYLAGKFSEAEARIRRAVALAPDVEVFQTALRLLQEEVARRSPSNSL